MSLHDFSRFAYQRRKQPLTLISSNENRTGPAAITPIKASSACSVPETPPERLIQAKTGRKWRQRKRPKRLLSTSEEEDEERREEGESGRGNTQSLGGLFSEVVASKRRKRNLEEAEEEDNSKGMDVKRPLTRVEGKPNPYIALSDSSDEDVSSSKNSSWNNGRKSSTLTSGPERNKPRKLQALNYVSTGLECTPGFIDPRAHRQRTLSFHPNGVLPRGPRLNSFKGEGSRFVGGKNANLKQLQELFPRHTKDDLDSALERSGGQLTEAVSDILASNERDSE